MKPDTPKDKNFEKFTKELNALLVRFDYVIQPILNFTPKGIFPTIELRKKEEKATNGNGDVTNGN